MTCRCPARCRAADGFDLLYLTQVCFAFGELALAARALQFRADARGQHLEERGTVVGLRERARQHCHDHADERVSGVGHPHRNHRLCADRGDLIVRKEIVRRPVCDGSMSAAWQATPWRVPGGDR